MFISFARHASGLRGAIKDMANELRGATRHRYKCSTVQKRSWAAAAPVVYSFRLHAMPVNAASLYLNTSRFAKHVKHV